MAANMKVDGLENTRESSSSQVYLVENEEHPEATVTDTAAGGAATISTHHIPHVKEFQSVDLSNSEKKRVPRRVIHFSDGVMEEYSTDEEDGGEDAVVQPEIDPKTLTWVPYIWYYMWYASSKTLGVCDFMGEKLAYFFGITSPKYQYAINEYNRLMEEEKEELEKLEKDRERKREQAAEKGAERVLLKGSGNAGNPGLATDL